MQISLLTIIIILALLTTINSVLAATIPTQPEGPTTLTIHNTTRREPTSSTTVQALAGNVTQLSIFGETVTQTWQGYYGNISGILTLDDEANHTMYDWTLDNPHGEIYVSRAEITFTHGNVFCYNYSQTDVGDSGFNELEEMEALFNIDADDMDGINETFTQNTNYTEFYVGSKKIEYDCPNVHLYNGSAESYADTFTEVLLYDNTSDELIFSTKIYDNINGFDNSTWDFQMLVLEDGHLGDTDSTAYYFYIELD